MVSRPRHPLITVAVITLLVVSLAGCRDASGKWFGVITVHDPATGAERASATLLAGTSNRVSDLYLVDAVTVPSGSDTYVAVVGHTEADVAGTRPTGRQDVVLALYAYDAELEELDRRWVRRIGSAREDERVSVAVSVAADDQGGIYVLGWTEGDFAKADAVKRSRDVFVAKYDRSGKRQWWEQHGTRFEDTPFAMAVAPAYDGTVAVVGSTMGDFDEDLETARRYPHGFVWIIDALTEPRTSTVRQVRADAFTVVNTVTFDSFGGSYVIAGETDAWLGADGGTNDGDQEAFVWRLNRELEATEKRQVVGEAWWPYVGTYGLHVDGSTVPLTLLAATGGRIFLERNALSDTASERIYVHDRRPSDSDMASDGTIWFAGRGYGDGVYGYLKQVPPAGAPVAEVVDVGSSVHLNGMAVSRDGTLLVTVGDDRCLAFCPEVD